MRAMRVSARASYERLGWKLTFTDGDTGVWAMNGQPVDKALASA